MRPQRDRVTPSFPCHKARAGWRCGMEAMVVASAWNRRLQSGAGALLFALLKRGRTGFDCWFETQAACRGSLVGLVKLPGKPINAKANITEVDFSGNSAEYALAA
jgi:hypothetical protein